MAIVALIGVQLYWVQSAYNLRKAEFNRKVMDALTLTADAVEKDNTCFQTISKVKINPYQGMYIIRQNWDSATEKWTSKPDSVHLFYLYPRDTSIENYPDIKFKDPATAEIIVRFQFETVDGVLWRKQPKEYSLNGLTGKDFRDRMTGDLPIYERIDTSFLDSVLKINLASIPQAADFQYGIIEDKTQKIAYAPLKSNHKKLLKSGLTVELFSDKNFIKPYQLAVFFPHENGIVLSSLWIMLLTSAVIVLLLVYSFWYFIRVMLRQKKLSEMKTDFINNMTHEFKTPVTNIALALETIGDDPHKLNGKLKPIFNIIGEENNRLRENVERILQIATVDKEGLELKLETIDLHMLICKVVRSFEMQIAHTNAELKCNLAATNAFVTGDETHIINILYNLIDNALKYTKGQPVINIETFNSKNGILLCVEDNGIGMNAITQKRIFDKFFRAQNGNVHDVKGVGLGLSYVKSIVDAHKGHIEVKSEFGFGSCFKVYLPYSFAHQ